MTKNTPYTLRPTKIEIKKLREAGYPEAMLGLSLSYKQPVEKMPEVALRLCHKDGGHNKFLESIVIWLDITAPRYWWQQFDTYRIGVTKQSESTMHTLMKRPLTQEDFVEPICPASLVRLNDLIATEKFEQLKYELPEGFLQRRIVCTNYKTLRHIINQRRTHRLEEWHTFIITILKQADHADLIFFTGIDDKWYADDIKIDKE